MTTDFDLSAIEKRVDRLAVEVRVAAAEGMTSTQWAWITTSALTEMLKSILDLAAEIDRVRERVEAVELRVAQIEEDH